MKVKILAFGVAKEIVNGASLEMEVEEGKTIWDLRSLLQDRYPSLQQLSSLMIAQNKEYAQNDDLLLPDSEVALIPPVSGG
jgi:molybdopterin synthase sulfur carrier subunit